MTRHLHAVPDVPEQRTVDIYDRWRAEVAARDWSSVHIKGDRREPVYIGWGGRGWRK